MALEGGKKASSARSRKCLQTIKAQSFNMRKDITNYTKTLPTKKRTLKTCDIKEVVVEPVVVQEVIKPVEPVAIKQKKPRKIKEVKLV